MSPVAVARLIEGASLLIVAWAAVRHIRARTWPTLLVLVVAGWLGEESAMTLYGWYGYAAGRWLLVVHRTPLAVTFVWPLVVLSSLDVAQRVRPWRARRAGFPHGRAALVAGALVVYDALVIEPVATRLGLWWWRAGSCFGVPALGLLGWGIFGTAASTLLGYFPLGPRGPWPRALWLAPAIAAATQVVLAPLVFGSLRLGLQVPLGEDGWAWGVGLLGLALCPLALRLRPLVALRFRDLGFKVAGSALFFAAIYLLRLWPFVLCCSSIPLPYLCLTLLHRERPAAASSSEARA